MLRYIFDALGDLFKNKLVDFGMGLAALVFVFPKVESLGDLNTTDARTIGIYVVTVIGVAVFFQILGVLFTWLSETMRVSISFRAVNIVHNLDELTGKNQKGQEVTIEYFGGVVVRNNEPTELTDCYAVVKLLRIRYSEHEWDHLGKRYRWKSNDDCQISIGAYNGEALLMIAEGQDHIGLTKYFSFRHAFCETDRVWLSTNHLLVFEFGLEVHGKLGGKDVRSNTYWGIVEFWPNAEGENKVRVKTPKL